MLLEQANVTTIDEAVNEEGTTMIDRERGGYVMQASKTRPSCLIASQHLHILASEAGGNNRWQCLAGLRSSSQLTGTSRVITKVA